MITRFAFLIAFAVSTYSSVLYRDEYGNLIRYRGRSDELDVYNKYRDDVRRHRLNDYFATQQQQRQQDEGKIPSRRYPLRRGDFAERRDPFKDFFYANGNTERQRFEDPDDERKYAEKHDSDLLIDADDKKDLKDFQREFEGKQVKADSQKKDLDYFRKEFEREPSKKDESNAALTKKDESEPAKKDDPKTAELKKDEPKPEETKRNEAEPEESKKDEPKPEESKKDEPKPKEPKIDQPKPEQESKKDEPKPVLKSDEKKTKYADNLLDDDADEKKDEDKKTKEIKPKVEDSKSSDAEEGKKVPEKEDVKENEKVAKVIKVSEDASPADDQSQKFELTMNKDMEDINQPSALNNLPKETPFKDNQYNFDLAYHKFREDLRRRDEAQRMRYRFNDYNDNYEDKSRQDFRQQDDDAGYRRSFDESMLRQRQQFYRDLMNERRARLQDAPSPRQPFRYVKENNDDFEQRNRKYPRYEDFAGPRYY